jgi:hypothetical protein
MASTINVDQTVVSNTFNQWRIRHNLLTDDVNEICRGDFVKPFGNVVISEGYVRISNSAGGVILDVKDDTNIDGTLTVFNIEVDNSTNHLYVDAGDIKFRRMGATDKFVVNTNTEIYATNVTISNVTSGTLNVNVKAVRINVGDTVNIANVDSTATVNIHPHVYLFANANISGTLNVTNNVFAYNLNVASNTATGNLIVRQLANIDNANIVTAYVRTLSVEDPILGPAETDSDKYVLRRSAAGGGDAYYRVRRGQAAGTANADLHWNEASTSWKFLYNNLPANVVMGNVSCTFKGTTEHVQSDTNSGTIDLDLRSSNWFKYTINGTTAFRFNNAPTESNRAITFSLIVIQDGTGGRNYSFANTIYWSGGLIPPKTLGSSSKDLWTFTSYDNGATYVGTLAVKDFR